MTATRLAAGITQVVAAGILLAVAGCEDTSSPAMRASAGVTAPNAGSPDELVAADNPATPDKDAADATNVATGDTTDTDEADAATKDPPAGGGASHADASASARPERTRDISFDDLKFDINKGDPFERSLLTEKVEGLEGKPIRIRGYILPSFQQSGLTQFVLVRDNQSCCFGPGAALYDCIIVEMTPGNSTDYSLYPVAVDGTFSIREMLDPDGKTVAIFHLDGESVR